MRLAQLLDAEHGRVRALAVNRLAKLNVLGHARSSRRRPPPNRHARPRRCEGTASAFLERRKAVFTGA